MDERIKWQFLNYVCKDPFIKENMIRENVRKQLHNTELSEWQKHQKIIARRRTNRQQANEKNKISTRISKTGWKRGRIQKSLVSPQHTDQVKKTRK